MKPLSEQSPPPSSSIEFEPQWVARQRQLKNQRRSSEERSMSSYANSARSLLSLSLSLSKTLYTSLSLSLSLSLILFFNFKKKNQITERLRDPRGLRRGGFSGTGPRNLATNGPRQRGFLRPVRIPCLFPQKKKKKFGRNLIFDLFIYLGFRLIGLTPMVNLQPNADFRPRLSR